MLFIPTQGHLLLHLLLTLLLLIIILTTLFDLLILVIIFHLFTTMYKVFLINLRTGSWTFEFDILAFTEAWLNHSVQSDDLVFQTFHKPERKDRRSDHFGGLLLYVKSGIFYKRKCDLEINGRFYTGPRNIHLNVCTTYQNPSLSLLLFGSSTLSFEADIAILEQVHKYILDTKLFT